MVLTVVVHEYQQEVSLHTLLSFPLTLVSVNKGEFSLNTYNEWKKHVQSFSSMEFPMHGSKYICYVHTPNFRLHISIVAGKSGVSI